MPRAEVHVLTVCRHGAGRSQIAAAAITQQWSTSAPLRVRVAGTAPKVPVRTVPETVRLILDEVGLAPVQDQCRALDAADLAWADVVVCFAEPETWPNELAAHPGLVAFTVADGAGRSVEFQRGMRDEVLAAVADLLPRLSPAGARP